jgi:preprotein translocase subunit SecG
MFVFLSILILICSILLVLFVLVQNSKGGGLAAGFSSSNQVLGVRKTTDFLEKTTWTLAGVLVVLCISISSFRPKVNNATDSSDVIQNVSAPPMRPSLPDFGTSLQDIESVTPVNATPETPPAN